MYTNNFRGVLIEFVHLLEMVIRDLLLLMNLITFSQYLATHLNI